jgi:hypothetical protein
MGLEEKRKIKELQEKAFPGRLKELADITGGAIAYDIDWDSFGDDAEGLKYLDNVACHRVNMALRAICKDDLGKEAVCDSLKTIRIHNIKDKAAKSITFDDGVLEMHCAYAKKLDGAYSDNDIHKTLMDGL